MKKILILDDDEIHNDLNVLMMNMKGITDIDIKTCVRDAVEYLENCKKVNEFPALMFVDLDLPGMNGFTFIRNFEANYRRYCPDTRIVMLTNSILDDDRVEAMNYESVLDFRSKPLNLEILSDILHKVKVDV